LALVKIVAASISAQKTMKEMLRIENTDSDFKVHMQMTYSKTFANKRSNNKLSKTGFGYG